MFIAFMFATTFKSASRVWNGAKRRGMKKYGLNEQPSLNS